MTMNSPYKTIAFQGGRYAYSHLAAQEAFPLLQAIPCLSFYDVFDKAEQDSSCVALVPVENSIAGRITEVHHLLAHKNLHIIREHYHHIKHCLLIHPDSRIDTITTVKSHAQALYQCRTFLHKMKWKQIAVDDTARAAGALIEKDQAAIASEYAATLYRLKVVQTNIADNDHNITRFLALHRQLAKPDRQFPSMTSIVFYALNRPSVLYHALGVFAKYQINLTRLEGIILPEQHFEQAQFYIDIEGHIDCEPLKTALVELRQYGKKIYVLGCYPADPFRRAS